MKRYLLLSLAALLACVALLARGTYSYFSDSASIPFEISFAPVTATCDFDRAALWLGYADGTPADSPVFDGKEDVTLNGGGRLNAVPDGTYYYQVTRPTGQALSDTRAVAVTGGSFTVPLAPFGDGPGGEYRAWFAGDPGFSPECAMHINFHVEKVDKPRLDGGALPESGEKPGPDGDVLPDAVEKGNMSPASAVQPGSAP